MSPPPRRSRWSRVARVFLVIGATLVVLVIVLLGAWRLSRSRSHQLFGELVTAVATRDSLVALTFDDGPLSPHTDAVLDLLRAEEVPATFFVIGRNVADNPALARRIVAEGHELGNHTFTHRRMVFVPPRTVRREVSLTDSVIRAAGWGADIHFRPPYGQRLVTLPWHLARTGRKTVLWTLEPDSWFRTADEMTAHVVEQVRPGAIILLHVEMPSRVAEREALPRIIDELRRRGYGFVTLSDLMARAASAAGRGQLP